MVFAGEAYNVEQGVSNEAFANERAAVAGCVYNGSPEDATKMIDDGGSTTGTAAQMSSDLVNFAAFMRFSAPPTAGGNVGVRDQRRQPVQHRRLRSLPYQYPDHRDVEIFRHVKCYLSSLFRLRLAPHGVGLPMASIREQPDRINSARLHSGVWASGCSSCTMAGPPTFCRPYRTMPRDCGSGRFRSAGSSTARLRLRSLQRDSQIQFAQPLADAGCVELPAFVVTGVCPVY